MLRTAIVLGLVLLAGCAARTTRRGAALDAAATAQAQAELQTLESYAAAGQSAEALRSAASLLERFPGFAAEDRVLLLGSQAAIARGDLRSADRWLQRLVVEFPASAEVRDAWWEIAELERQRQMPGQAAEGYARFLAGRNGDERETAAARAFEVLLREQLQLAELKRLEELQLGPEAQAGIQWQLLHLLELEGGSQEELGRRANAYVRDHPNSPHGEAARQLLAGLRSEGVEIVSDASASSDLRIGILCPVTGENAALGQAMYDGAQLASEEHERQGGKKIQLISLDTRADGVRAVQMAQVLIEQEGVLAIVGELLTHTTVPVATLCQERRVPLVSPTATQETIADLGEYVFQTNLTRGLETRLVARAAVEVLLRRRFAILHPPTDEGRQSAELFARHVEALGASVVAVEELERGSTDMRPALERLRLVNPEAIYAPVPPSDMRLIAPQLTFVGLETQLLGPSSWNNSLLAREVGEYLDRAVFTSDIALIPEADQQRFEAQWARRFPGQSSNAFALKTYFAVQLVLRGIEEGQRSRPALQRWLAAQRKLATDDLTLSLEKLRVLQGGEYLPFPMADFLRPADPPAATESGEGSQRH